jgi:hypothetical protein
MSAEPFNLSVLGDVLELVIGDKSAKVKIPKGERGPAGRDGISIRGEKGEKGEKGEAGRDSTVAGPTGEKGEKGDCGDRGITPQISVGTVVAGESPAVIMSGTPEKPIFNFVIPRGERGMAGPRGLDGKHGNHEYIDILCMGNSPRFTDEMCGKYVIMDGIVEMPEMTESDIGRWVHVKTFMDLSISGLVEEPITLRKGESAKLVVIGYGSGFKFSRF